MIIDRYYGLLGWVEMVKGVSNFYFFSLN